MTNDIKLTLDTGALASSLGAAGAEISRVAREPFAYLPDAALDLAGKLIYKRLG